MSNHILTQLVPPDPDDSKKNDALQGTRNADLRKKLQQLTNDRFGNARVTLPDPVRKNIIAAKLFIDRIYERPMDLTWVRRIASGFDPDKFHPILVSDRGNGTYAVIDGQHRIAALDYMGWLDQNVPCLVYSGLTIEEEAELFATQSDVKPVAKHDDHRAKVVARREVPLSIQKILNESGYRVDRGSRLPDNIQAIQAVYSVYEKSSPDMLVTVLRLLGLTWRPKMWQPNSAILQGLRYFLTRYSEHDAYREERLLEILAGIGPKDFHDLTSRQMSIVGGSQGANGARVLLQRYNLKLRGNRLPDWDVQVVS